MFEKKSIVRRKVKIAEKQIVRKVIIARRKFILAEKSQLGKKNSCM